MKKGRPGVVLHVLAAAADRDRLADVVFAETSTFGLRVAARRALYADERRETVTIAGKEVGVRLGLRRRPPGDGVARVRGLRAVAAAVGRPVKVVYEAAQAAARKRFSAS